MFDRIIYEKYIMKKFIGIDFGTSNTFVYLNGKGIIYSEPSIIAIDKNTNAVIETGFLASKMIGRSAENVEIIHPIKRGVPARFKPCIQLLETALKKVKMKSLRGYQILFSIPSDITPIEKSIYVDLAKQLDANDVIFENQAKLASLGAGVSFKENRGTMHINIGGGTSNIIVMSNDRVLVSKSSIFCGNLLDEAILRYLRKQRHLLIGNKTAEFIKMKIGSLEASPENRLLEVAGRDILTSLPHNVTISTNEVKQILLPLAELLVDAINDALIITPPEIASDITETGVVISGGSSLLSGIREYIEKNINIPVRMAPDPIAGVANGMANYIKEIK